MSAPLILDLCGGTGSWSKPYVDRGYEVRLITLPDNDVRAFSTPKAHGVLAAPPCTEFAASGARWWAEKPPELLAEAIEVVRACLRIISEAKPSWWALENPVGRIQSCVPELGEPWSIFDPYDFGDPWSKRTYLWGRFARPKRSPVVPKGPNPIHRMPPGPDRQRLRSITPAGFALAFAEANP